MKINDENALLELFALLHDALEPPGAWQAIALRRDFATHEGLIGARVSRNIGGGQLFAHLHVFALAYPGQALVKARPLAHGFAQAGRGLRTMAFAWRADREA